jgi:hypothetical protein
VLKWVEIPRFQRGVSWRSQQIQDFLESTSVVYGNVTLANFTRVAGQFPQLPPEIQYYYTLVDGLQRFAVGTAILSLLHPKMFVEPPPHAAAHLFRPMRVALVNASLVYLHNDRELSNHPRLAIRSQYAAMKEELGNYLDEELASTRAENLATVIKRAFLVKQVAIDEYLHFGNALELMNTFLGMNTIRMELGPLDLLRSVIVQQGEHSSWSPSDVEEIENRFTEVFTEDEAHDRPDSELLPFARIVYETIVGSSPARGSPTTVFRSWSRLTKDEVNGFLDYVNGVAMWRRGNPYFDEIRTCGSNPFAILLSYYYRDYQTAPPRPGTSVADWMATRVNAPSLHKLLIGCYRYLFSGAVGRTREYAERLLRDPPHDLDAVADEMSRDVLHVGVQDNPDPAWLSAFLNRCDKLYAKRVFTAYLLPPRGHPWGGVFERPVFGRQTDELNVDHLIPISRFNHRLVPAEIETIRNFAPLPSQNNRRAAATDCSNKLGPGGMYENWISAFPSGVANSHHPYGAWIVSESRTRGWSAELDQHALLEPAKHPGVGDSRIEYLRDHLLSRV